MASLGNGKICHYHVQCIVSLTVKHAPTQCQCEEKWCNSRNVKEGGGEMQPQISRPHGKTTNARSEAL